MKIFIRNNRKIHISDTVIEIFEKHKQKNNKDNESGGILIGQVTSFIIVVEGQFILENGIPTLKIFPHLQVLTKE